MPAGHALRRATAPILCRAHPNPRIPLVEHPGLLDRVLHKRPIHPSAESSTLAIHAAQQTASVKRSRYARGTFTVSACAGERSIISLPKASCSRSRDFLIRPLYSPVLLGEIGIDKPIRESRRADSNRLPLLQLRACGQWLQSVARGCKPRINKRFLFPRLPSIAACCVRTRVNMS
jgi:hypothetical protein